MKCPLDLLQDKMFLFYIDESGTGSNDKETNYFVLASIAISENYSLGNYEEILSLKQNIVKGRDPEKWELKGHNLVQGKDVFKGWSSEARSRTFLKIAEKLNQLPCDIFAVVVDKKLLYSHGEEMKDESSLYCYTLYRLLKELDGFLKCFNASGILFFDSRLTHSSSVQDERLIKDYRQWVKSQKYNSSFVEQPWLGSSRFYVGLQLADYIAYLINLKKQQVKEGNLFKAECIKAFDILQSKIHLIEIPEN